MLGIGFEYWGVVRVLKISCGIEWFWKVSRFRGFVYIRGFEGKC